MSNTPTVMLNGDQIYIDELIRENARLTIQHEADQQIIDVHRKRAAELEVLHTKTVAEYEDRIAGYKEDLDGLIEAHNQAEETIPALQKKLAKAIADLHFVMAGGDPCKVCTVKCAFGAGNCKPVWHGEEESQ